MKGHYRIQGPVDFTGTLHGVEFENGFAYVNWQALGEDETRVALDRIGQDPRGFVIREIAEQDSPFGSKEPKQAEPEPEAEPVVIEKPARKARRK